MRHSGIPSLVQRRIISYSSGTKTEFGVFMKMTKSTFLTAVCATLFSLSAFASNVVSFNMSLGSDGQYHCYASDLQGNTPNGAAGADANCCVSNGVTHFAFSLGADNANHCYASTAEGYTPAGTGGSDDACCE
jgi:hypothetical protein